MNTSPTAQPHAPLPSKPAWNTTTTVADLAALLRSARSVAVTTHAKPDGDAIGSTLALARALRTLKVDARVLLIGPVPHWLPEVAGDTPIIELPHSTPCDAKVVNVWSGQPPDAVAVVDTGTWAQLIELQPWLSNLTDRACIVDHHLHGDADMAPRRLIKTDAASCTEVLAPVCVELLGVRSAAKLPREIAEPIYLGLATDTGWFRYSSVTPATLRLAADTLESGIDHTRLYRLIEQQDQPGRWRLLARALSTLELHDSNRVATMALTLADFTQAGADRNDTGGFADVALTISSVELSVVMTEQAVAPGQPPLTKFSLRSKPGPHAIDVNALASRIGGGGHARAAGAKVHAPLAQAKQRLLDALRELEGRKA